MSVQLLEFNNTFKQLGLSINTRKCRSLSVFYSRSTTPLVDSFLIDGEKFQRAEDIKKIKYLGNPIDTARFTDSEKYQDEILALANAIADLKLFPWIKLEAMTVFIFSKLHFLMRIGTLRIANLQKL